MDGFTTVFVFTQKAPDIFKDDLGRMALGGVFSLFFIFAGVMALRNLIVNREFKDGPLVILIAGFAVLLGVNWVMLHAQDYARDNQEYSRLANMYDEHRCKVAEGVVHVSHIQAPGGHDQGDIIDVGGIEFEISYYERTFGYSQSLAHGGVLSEGSYARICYDVNDSPYGVKLTTILQVDLKNPPRIDIE